MPRIRVEEGVNRNTLVRAGSGIEVKSIVLAQADRMAHVTCLERPDVLGVARDLAERMHVLSQVAFLPGDLRRPQRSQ
jgi:hypothetical protein